MPQASSVFFYSITIGFFCGVFVRSLVSFGLAEIVWVILLAVVVGLIGRRNGEAISAPYVVALGIFLFVAALGALRVEYASWSVTNPVYESQLGTDVVLEGVIAREPDIRERTVHLYTKVEDEIILVTTSPFGVYEYGDQVTVVGELSKPESFETDYGRTFNYPGYLLARNVTYTINFAQVEVLESGQGNVVISSLLHGKRLFMDSIEALLPEPQVGLSEGLLLGVKRALGEDLEEVFRATGIIHIVVLSGYNVMLVVTFVLAILSFLFSRRIQTTVGLLAIVAFTLLVGLSATVIRASIMAALLLVAKATGNTYAVTRALLFAAVLMLLLNPYLLVYDVGFQLSFLATLGLILLAPHVEGWLTWLPRFMGVRTLVSATIAAQIAVMPLLLYQIGEFSVVAVVVNALVLPMVPVAMLLTFITGLLGFVAPALAAVSAYFTHLSLTYILVVAEYFGNLPFASYPVPPFSFALVPISYALLGYLLWRLENKSPSVKDPLDEWTIVEER